MKKFFEEKAGTKSLLAKTMNPQHPNLCLRDLKPEGVLILNAALGFNWGGCIF